LSDREMFSAKDLTERNETKVLRDMVTMKERERERESARESATLAVTRAHW
jgi:hypothetical protein